MLKKIIILLAVAIVLAACNTAQETTPTPTRMDPNIVRTAAAQTADARRSATPVLTSTDTPVPSTPTPDLVQTEAAQQTEAAMVTPTVGPTVTNTPNAVAGADNNLFTGIETVPDGTDYAPGAHFTKSWQFKNTGTSTWDTTYVLMFIDGDNMGGPVSVAFPNKVAPNETVELSVSLVAPSTVGTYKGFWRMYNPAANLFFGDSVYIQIDVAEGGSPGDTP